MIGGISAASIGTAAYIVNTRKPGDNNDLLIHPQPPSISSPTKCDNNLKQIQKSKSTSSIDKKAAKLMSTVIKPGIEPYALTTTYTKNHATEEEIHEITDINKYMDKYPIIPLSQVREHYSPDVGDGTVWVTWKGGVYDVTQFMDHHPGKSIYCYSVQFKNVTMIVNQFRRFNTY